MRLVIIHFKEILMSDDKARLAEIRLRNHDVLQGVPKNVTLSQKQNIHSTIFTTLSLDCEYWFVEDWNAANFCAVNHLVQVISVQVISCAANVLSVQLISVQVISCAGNLHAVQVISMQQIGSSKLDSVKSYAVKWGDSKWEVTV